MSASSRRRWASSLLQKTKKKRKNIFQIESFICVVFNQFRKVICVEARKRTITRTRSNFKDFFTYFCKIDTPECFIVYLFFTRKDNMVVFTVAQKGHTCKLKMLLQTKNFTCKSKITHANYKL